MTTLAWAAIAFGALMLVSLGWFIWAAEHSPVGEETATGMKFKDRED